MGDINMPRFYASLEDNVTPREKENREIAYQAATESITLLKNEKVLPIKPGKIAVFGSASIKMVKGGTGSGEVNERHVIGIVEGLKNAGFTVNNADYEKRYMEEYDAAREEYKKTSKVGIPIGQKPIDLINVMANQFKIPAGPLVTEKDVKVADSKVCIYAIARQAGECADRSLEKNDFTFMEREIENLKFLATKYKKLILVINVGGSMDMSVLDEVPGINAVIYMCQQGMESGRALADILTGKVNPSGGLTDTWIMNYKDVPYGDGFGDMDGNPLETDYKEGIYVGYRYYDTFKVPVRYPFGYGLSYTTFSYDYKKTVIEGNTVAVDVDIKNTGTVAGKKFVQIYASCPKGELEKEDKRLVGYAKSKLLKAGEIQTVTVTFDMHALASYSEERAAYILEEGNYILSIGANVAETKPVCVLLMPATLLLEQCTNICARDTKFEELKREEGLAINTAGLDSVTADIYTIAGANYDYSSYEEVFHENVEDWMGKLAVEQKLELLAGTGMMGASKPTLYVPGSAAYTKALPELNIPSTALCDGPAGIRLQRVSALTKKGQIKPMEMMMDFMNEWPEFLKKMTTGDAKKDTMLYQNATSFPVGTALAMTWNQELLEQVGDAVGREMEEFGCTFWLAPGMNIHRNPLCGRNYEYYSEDPVVSGKTAAAITRGVQKHEGCYVTIKHFACNNQETNRAGTSANVSERALREIYLEGFRIAVKEGGAKAVMTSYNKVNHVYAPNSHDLCTKVLRNEWGFAGVVMTDWLSTEEGLAERSAAYKAGNDLIMPGGKATVKECLKDYKAGTLTIDEIDTCCRRVLHAVASSGMTCS